MLCPHNVIADIDFVGRISDELRGRTGPPMGPKGSWNMFINEIANIEMIINPIAFRVYSKYADKLAKRNIDAQQDLPTSVPANEWWMKYGSGKTEPSEIADSDYGLNFNIHDESDYFGRGAYVAEDSSYVDSFRKFQLADGIHAQMFLVLVAAGVIKEEQSSSKEHMLLKDAPLGFNSIRGRLTDSCTGIVTCRQNSTYPAYLITYKRTL